MINFAVSTSALAPTARILTGTEVDAALFAGLGGTERPAERQPSSPASTISSITLDSFATSTSESEELVLHSEITRDASHHLPRHVDRAAQLDQRDQHAGVRTRGSSRETRVRLAGAAPEARKPAGGSICRGALLHERSSARQSTLPLGDGHATRITGGRASRISAAPAGATAQRHYGARHGAELRHDTRKPLRRAVASQLARPLHRMRAVSPRSCDCTRTCRHASPTAMCARPTYSCARDPASPCSGVSVGVASRAVAASRPRGVATAARRGTASAHRGVLPRAGAARCRRCARRRQAARRWGRTCSRSLPARAPRVTAPARVVLARMRALPTRRDGRFLRSADPRFPSCACRPLADPARACCAPRAEDRPPMRVVAEHLDRMSTRDAVDAARDGRAKKGGLLAGGAARARQLRQGRCWDVGAPRVLWKCALKGSAPRNSLRTSSTPVDAQGNLHGTGHRAAHIFFIFLY